MNSGALARVVIATALAAAACGQSAPPEPAPARPLIFIPGFAGSELVATEFRRVTVPTSDGSTKEITLSRGDVVWPHFSTRDLDVRTPLFEPDYYRVLRLGDDGFGPGFIVPNGKLYTDVDGYGEVEPFFTSHGYQTDRDLFLFGWDWRRSAKDEAERLDELVARVLGQTGASSVDIVAHSTGTFVLRWFMLTKEARSRIAHAIFLGGPGLGMPGSVDALIAGQCVQVIPVIDRCVVPPDVMRYVFATSPGAVHGATSADYYRYFDGRDGSHLVAYVATATDGYVDPAQVDYRYLRDVMLARGVSESAIASAMEFHLSDRVWLAYLLTQTSAKIAIGGGSGKCALGQLSEGAEILRRRVDGDTMVPRQSALFGDAFELGYQTGIVGPLAPSRLLVFMRPLEHGELSGNAGLPDVLALLRDQTIDIGSVRQPDCGTQ